jgi:hypothetical protein
VVLCFSQDGACTDSFENFRENSLNGDLSNNITLNPPLFSLVNTFNIAAKTRESRGQKSASFGLEEIRQLAYLHYIFTHSRGKY